LFRQAGFEPASLTSPAGIRTLPTMDKETVLANLEQLMTCSPKSAGVEYISTGGTSGAPLAFFAPTNRSAIEYAYLTTSWERTGYRLGDQMAVLRGRVVRPDPNGLRHEHDPLLRHHYYSNFHLNEANGMAYLSHIATLGPCVMHAYPSAACSLAKIALQNPGAAPANIKAVLLESENLFPDQKNLIEEAFGVVPFSCYGHSEKLVLAAGCERSGAYHVWPTYGYFELLDERGEAVTTPGQRGEIVGTGFINTVVPMIRYRTGDFATYGGDHCEECGRNHLILREIEGRWPQGNLMAADGGVISMTALNMHDDCMRSVQDYQFMQDQTGEAIMFVTPSGDWSENERQRVDRMINQRLQGQVRIFVIAVDKVYRTKIGKLPRVINSRQREQYARDGV
jgi:phenylacetate-CoA ligase